MIIFLQSVHTCGGVVDGRGGLDDDRDGGSGGLVVLVEEGMSFESLL